jgi:hypothetical protein
MTPVITAASAAGHADPITVILLILAAAAAYAVSLYLWPSRKCPRCRGTRITKSGTGRRIGMCKRCSGTGRTRRIGATAVHRFYWSALGDQAQQRRRDRADRRRQQTGPPDL